MADATTPGCQISDLFALLGERHVPDILHLILQRRSVRFTTIQDELAMSPNTLSDRLKKLAAAGLVTRNAYQEIPPRVEYEPTGKAQELAPLFAVLTRWAERHTLTADEAT